MSFFSVFSVRPLETQDVQSLRKAEGLTFWIFPRGECVCVGNTFVDDDGEAQRNNRLLLACLARRC